MDISTPYLKVSEHKYLHWHLGYVYQSLQGIIPVFTEALSRGLLLTF